MSMTAAYSLQRKSTFVRKWDTSFKNKYASYTVIKKCGFISLSMDAPNRGELKTRYKLDSVSESCPSEEAKEIIIFFT